MRVRELTRATDGGLAFFLAQLYASERARRRIEQLHLSPGHPPRRGKASPGIDIPRLINARFECVTNTIQSVGLTICHSRRHNLQMNLREQFRDLLLSTQQ